jgi:hypothetical protein
MKWSKEEEKVLRELIKLGTSAKEIQTVLKDRSVSAITCKAYNLGLKLAGEGKVDMENYEKLKRVYKV